MGPLIVKATQQNVHVSEVFWDLVGSNVLVLLGVFVISQIQIHDCKTLWEISGCCCCSGSIELNLCIYNGGKERTLIVGEVELAGAKNQERQQELAMAMKERQILLPGG